MKYTGFKNQNHDYFPSRSRQTSSASKQGRQGRQSSRNMHDDLSTPNKKRQLNKSNYSKISSERNHPPSLPSPTSSPKYQNRIEKICTSNTPQMFKKQIQLLKAQIQRLEKENWKKDNQLFLSKSGNNNVHEIESQLEQAYRVIFFYEGKNQQLEKQSKMLQKTISQNVQKTTLSPQVVEGLLNEYRDQNTLLKATLEEQNRVIVRLQQKIRDIQAKYFQATWELSNQKRIEADPLLKKRFPKLRNAIIINQIPLSERQKLQKITDQKNSQSSGHQKNGEKGLSIFSEQLRDQRKDQQRTLSKQKVHEETSNVVKIPKTQNYQNIENPLVRQSFNTSSKTYINSNTQKDYDKHFSSYQSANNPYQSANTKINSYAYPKIPIQQQNKETLNLFPPPKSTKLTIVGNQASQSQIHRHMLTSESIQGGDRRNSDSKHKTSVHSNVGPVRYSIDDYNKQQQRY